MAFSRRTLSIALPIALLLSAASLAAFRKFAHKEYRLARAWAEIAWVESTQRIRRTDTGAAGAPMPLLDHVAHAGGGIGGRTYTNSLEALDYNYRKGFRLFEIDLEWTSDGQLVLVHAWSEETRFPRGGDGPVSLDDFLAAAKDSGLTRLDMDGLAGWMTGHPDAYVVTDVKRDNIAGLRLIWDSYPAIRNNIIPQIYFFTEYARARAIGYDAIILTLYAAGYPDGPVIAFAARHPLAAVTIPVQRGYSPLPVRLARAGIPVFVHTVNDLDALHGLRVYGARAVYTDFLSPGD